MYTQTNILPQSPSSAFVLFMAMVGIIYILTTLGKALREGSDDDVDPEEE